MSSKIIIIFAGGSKQKFLIIKEKIKKGIYFMSEIEGTVVAITGGFCSGKSTVAKFIEELGFKVIYTDEFTKELMVSLEPLKQELKSLFGEETYLPNGKLNKEYLKEKVFCGTDECKGMLKKLNSIVHPYVLVEREKLIEECISNGESHVFVESALIYEASIEEFFDYVIVVHSPRDLVISRAKQRGFSENEILHRLDSQMSPEEKRNLADFTIENKSSLDDLRKAVDFILGII
jgi:dephospho-CoA kinase